MKAPIPINDDARQRYLREMGIALYYPRRPLPGAAASRRYSTNAEGGHEEAECTVAGKEKEPGHVQERAGAGGRGASASLNGLKSSLTVGTPAAPARRQTSLPTTRRPVTEADAGDALAFRFTWFRPDDRLGVIAGHQEARLPTPFLRMLQRILAALSPRYRDMVLQGEPFHWPLDAAMPGDVDAARQVVRAFLRRRCGGTQPPFTLILMDEPPVWLLPAEAGEAAATMLAPVSVPGRPEQILRVPALETMARDASAKRPAWDAMQSLIRPLAQCDRD